MKKSSFFLAFIAVAILLVTSCSPSADTTTPAQTSPSPTTPGDDISILVDGNTEFTFDLYRELKGSEGNFFFSPYSISTALTMTYATLRLVHLGWRVIKIEEVGDADDLHE